MQDAALNDQRKLSGRLKEKQEEKEYTPESVELKPSFLKYETYFSLLGHCSIYFVCLYVCMLLLPCCVRCAVCYMLYVVCCILLVVCCVLNLHTNQPLILIRIQITLC